MRVAGSVCYPLYLLTTTYGRHVDRRGKDGGPKLDVTVKLVDDDKLYLELNEFDV